MGRSLFRGSEGRLSSRAASALPWLCLAAAGVLLGRFAVAWWERPDGARWRLPQADMQYAAGLAAQRHWFGAVPEQAQTAAPLNVQVLGVWASLADASSSVAVLDDNGRHVALPVGRTLPSGWSLAQVQASGVLLRQAGVEQFIPLRRVPASAATQAATDFSSSLAAPQAAGVVQK